jgi:YceI-like domain
MFSPIVAKIITEKPARRVTGAAYRSALSVVVVSLSVTAIASTSAFAAAKTKSAVKSGAKCTTAGATSGALVCAKKAGKLVWAKGAAPAASVVGTTPAAGATATTLAAGGATPAAAGSIDGTWKATDKSVVAYRVKETLNGQDTEGVGKTNAVVGTLTIAGTKATAVELTADLTTLKSDEARRDSQVQGRILETSKFPKATLKLKAPIDFGKDPKDGEQISAKGTVSLNLHGVTKELPVELTARKNGAVIEVKGEISITFADFGIVDPSFPPFVTTDPKGLLEFLIIFAR